MVGDVIFVLFVFTLTCLFFGLVGGVLYLIYVPFRNKLKQNGKLSVNRSKKINWIYILVLLVFCIYQTYDSFFPSESFYEEEFKEVTLRDFPKSAEFISKNASYPDFHGDYCSSSQIKLSKEDYQRLLLELKVDNRITKNGENIGFEEFFKTLGEKKSDKFAYEFTRSMEGEEDHYLYIAFYDDNQTIFVNVCVS